MHATHASEARRLDESADDMVRNADLAIYGAKQAGRNQALAWVDPAPPLAPAARRVCKAGKISFNAGQSTIDCTVRGLSRDTATIEVTSASDIPEPFKLAIASDALSRVCRITAKADTRIEVAFTRSIAPRYHAAVIEGVAARCRRHVLGMR